MPWCVTAHPVPGELCTMETPKKLTFSTEIPQKIPPKFLFLLLIMTRLLWLARFPVCLFRLWLFGYKKLKHGTSLVNSLLSPCNNPPQAKRQHRHHISFHNMRFNISVILWDTVPSFHFLGRSWCHIKWIAFSCRQEGHFRILSLGAHPCRRQQFG